MDKQSAIIQYLSDCPQIRSNSLFFNFINAKDNNKQLVIDSSDVSTNTTYIDGSVQKRYTFTIIDYRSIAYNAIVKMSGYENENVSEFLDVQGIIDWITQQNKLRNFPNFGEDCIIDEIRALTNTPTLNGVDSTVKPSLAKYSVSIRVDYLDTSECCINQI